MSGLRATPLHEEHVRSGAKLVDFAGWAMPVSYAGIGEEVKSVRTAAGMFDVSHMGEVELQGKGATAALQGLLTNDVSRIEVGGCIYSPMCNGSGGTVDDLIALRLNEADWLLVINASRVEADIRWIVGHLCEEVRLIDRSSDFALIAVQGPAAEACLERLTDFPLSTVHRNAWVNTTCSGVPVTISRTGYTGEDGFEIFLPPEHAAAVWRSLSETGSVAPCGLGARDVLRLEAGLCLYGHELTEEISPLEAGIEWTVKWNKESFIGREALIAQKAEGPARRLVGLEMCDRAVPRQGYPVIVNARVAGAISSGTYSTTLEKGIALAFVESAFAEAGRFVDVEIRSVLKPARIVKTPLYSHPKENRDES